MSEVFESLSSLPLHLEHVLRRRARRREQALDRLLESWRTALMASSRSGWSAGCIHQGAEYLLDAAERAWLTCDTLQRSARSAVAAEADPLASVLAFAHETVVDGQHLSPPVNYSLIKVGSAAETDPAKRPFVIFDPRSGQGPGLSGFKADSQIGIALRDRHPVYLVAFSPEPKPDQSVADVVQAQTHFLRVVGERHPEAPKPIVLGNCQGGWSAMLVAAREPELPGIVVLNGSPLTYWVGNDESSMRFLGGLGGGALPCVVAADLAGGRFDGAHLVYNFGAHNPGRAWFRKYYELFAGIDDVSERFLAFERWWNRFHDLGERELRWILQNLFIGNRLSAEAATVQPSRPFDITTVPCPILVFTSRGDVITPPAQALGWIADAYSSVDEIRARGQRIAYYIHEDVGHLGLVASSGVAKHAHEAITRNMPTIASLAPGLYEIRIDGSPASEDTGAGLRFEPRTIDQLGVEPVVDPEAFRSAARFSDRLLEAYDRFWRPWVRAMAHTSAATGVTRAMRAAHPLRLPRAVMGERFEPALRPLEAVAAAIRSNRHRASDQNPFRLAERRWADFIHATWDAWSCARDIWTETAFYTLWTSDRPAPAPTEDRSSVVNIVAAAQGEVPGQRPAHPLAPRIDAGSVVAAVIRMLILLESADDTLSVARLNPVIARLTVAPEFASFSSDERLQLVESQAQWVEYDRDAARAALRTMLNVPGHIVAARRLWAAIAPSWFGMTVAQKAELTLQHSVLADEGCLSRRGPTSVGDPHRASPFPTTVS